MSAVLKPVSAESAHPAAQAAADTISARLARFAAGLRYEDVPARVLERARLHILDCLGIGLASTMFDFAHRAFSGIAAVAGPGPHMVIGMPARLPLRDAILMNGTLIHGLDFDDTHTGGVIHASASAVPTVLGAGIAQRASGREALTAYLLAVEASARIGAAARGGFHQIGFHPTGLVGAFGATLAAARLNALTAEQMQHAQGIVLSLAAGSLEFLEDGAWTKRMHPGWAGFVAVQAAGMARGGYIGPKRAYEGRFGLFNTHLAPGHGADLGVCTKGLDDEWEMLNVALKPYAACHFNHAFADAALALRNAHGVRPEDVKSIKARIGAGQTKVVCEPEANKRRPANSYDAQFSVHYTIAASLVHGRFTLAELEPDALADPRAQALMDVTSYEVDPESAFPRYYSGEVVIETRDGRRLTHRESQNRGSDARPLTADEIIAKFRANAERAVSPARAQQVLEAVLGLDEAKDLTALDRALSLA